MAPQQLVMMSAPMISRWKRRAMPTVTVLCCGGPEGSGIPMLGFQPPGRRVGRPLTSIRPRGSQVPRQRSRAGHHVPEPAQVGRACPVLGSRRSPRGTRAAGPSHGTPVDDVDPSAMIIDRRRAGDETQQVVDHVEIHRRRLPRALGEAAAGACRRRSRHTDREYAGACGTERWRSSAWSSHHSDGLLITYRSNSGSSAISR